MIEVTAKDGSVVTFDDNTPQDVILRAMRKHESGPGFQDPPTLAAQARGRTEAATETPTSPIYTGPTREEPGAPVGGVPWYRQPRVEPPPDRPGMLAAQTIGKGLAGVVSAPAELATMALNAGVVAPTNLTAKYVLGKEGPVMADFPSPSLGVRSIAGKLFEDTTGIPLLNTGELTSGKKAIYDIGSAATEGAAFGGGLRLLTPRAMARVEAGGKPGFGDTMLAPYQNPLFEGGLPYGAGWRPHFSDIGIGAGTGAAQHGITEGLPKEYGGWKVGDSPIVQALGGFAGGGAGALGAQALWGSTKALGRGVRGAAGAVGVGPGNLSDLPTGELGKSYLRASEQEASRALRDAASDPDAALARLKVAFDENRAVGMAPGEMPPALNMTRDPGLELASTKTALGDPRGAIEQGQRAQGGIVNALEGVLPPASVTAEPLQRAAQGEAGQRIYTASREVADVDRQLAAEVRRSQEEAANVAALRERDAAALSTTYPPRAGEEASARIHGDVTNIRGAVGERQSQLYGNRLIQTAQVPRDPLFNIVEEIAGRPRDPMNPNLHPVVEEFIHRLRPEQTTTDPATGAVTVTRPGLPQTPTNMDAVNKLRADLEPAIERLRSGPERNSTALNQLIEIKDATSAYIDMLIARGGPAAEAALAARSFHANTVAPNFRQGTGGNVDAALRANPDAANLVPSQFAGQFASSPEAVQDLMRIGRLRDPQQMAANMRDWMMTEFTKNGVSRNGVVDPVKAEAWRRKNAGEIDAVPGLRRQVDDIVDVAHVRADAAEGAATRVGEAQQRARVGEREGTARINDVQRQIDQSALGKVIGPDIDQSMLIHGIMGDPATAQARMQQLLDLTATDPAARQGLRAAVRDYILDKGTKDPNSRIMPPDDPRAPVSAVNMNKLLAPGSPHEQILSRVFDQPGEMQALRVINKAANMMFDRQAVGGSPTVERQIMFDRLREHPLGKGLEAATRFHYGVLETGGKLSAVRRALSGIGQRQHDEVLDLIRRARGDPELAMHLLGMKQPIGTPAWNVTMGKFLSAYDAGKHYNEQFNEPEDPGRVYSRRSAAGGVGGIGGAP